MNKKGKFVGFYTCKEIGWSNGVIYRVERDDDNRFYNLTSRDSWITIKRSDLKKHYKETKKTEVDRIREGFQEKVDVFTYSKNVPVAQQKRR